MTVTNRTRDQELAKYAADCIASIDTKQKEFKSLVRNFPALIMTSGLSQALAFLNAKHEDQHNYLYKFISKWISKKIYDQESDNVLPLIITNDSLKYRHALQEAMDLATWLKRFAEAKITDQGEQGNE